jgi:hypothetical protein
LLVPHYRQGGNEITFLTKAGVHGERRLKAREVVEKLAGRVRRPGTDTIPVEVWNQVKTSLAQRNWSDMDFALATNTRFDGPRMWTHAPGRPRLHRISVILGDPALHNLATSDIYWDKIVDIVSSGHREVCGMTEAKRHPVVVQGVLVR